MNTESPDCRAHQQLGTVWTTPRAINISQQLKTGRNQLAIEVTNNWNNRLVADAGLEPAKRLSHFSKGCGFYPQTPLQAR